MKCSSQPDDAHDLSVNNEHPYVIEFSKVSSESGDLVGGKNASLGEMLQALTFRGVRVPDGFAVTSHAYRAFIKENGLAETISAGLTRFEKDPKALAEIGRDIRQRIMQAHISEALRKQVLEFYHKMSDDRNAPISVAVRSSATAEDLPEASFAGQLETYLNVSGDDDLIEACKRCFASLFTDRAISYRRSHGFAQIDIAISVGIQRMVRSDKACAGVMFSIDTETGFPNAILINGAWGLGETVVQGTVDPDEFEVFKPLATDKCLLPIIRKRCGSKTEKMIYADKSERPTVRVETTKDEQLMLVLNDEEILTLARWAILIEDHYGLPMDMEWAKDGETGELFIVQARPETVQSRRNPGVLRTYHLQEDGEKLLEGLAIGDAIACGSVCRIDRVADITKFKEGSVLVTATTDPDWVPIMKKAAAIITDHGGRTSHAAIVSRELGLPAIIGVGNATAVLNENQEITVSCAEGATGAIYKGHLAFSTESTDLNQIPDTRTDIMLNLANPSSAFRWWQLPASGVGLARIEFIISNLVKIHPMALVNFERVTDKSVCEEIEAMTSGYESKTEYFVDRLAQGVARIAAGFYPYPVIVRMSDFKSNEYASLIGGRDFEPEEDNPMLGWRGASRYYDDGYRAGFSLECQAMSRVRDRMGLKNVKLMIPFCRTPSEADKVIQEMEANGLKRGQNGLELYVMAEIPSNILLADAFSNRFDGFSIGSNDLTQLTLGIDRDSERLQPLFDERNEAVKAMISNLLTQSKALNTPVGICGEAPSNYPEFAQFLVQQGINSISVSPDSFLTTKNAVAAAEAAV